MFSALTHLAVPSGETSRRSTFRRALPGLLHFFHGIDIAPSLRPPPPHRWWAAAWPSALPFTVALGPKTLTMVRWKLLVVVAEVADILQSRLQVGVLGINP